MPPSLHCSCASRTTLKTVALEPGLPAAVCPDCGAVLLQMDDWRRWRSRAPQTPTAAAPAAEPLADTDRARACPACTRLMQRLPVHNAQDFRVDRCIPCQYLWLDPGEWAALVQLGAALQLDTLLSDAGQRRLQSERLLAARMQTLRQRHGDERIDEVLRFRRWLAGQPLADELLALLRSPEGSLP